MPRNFTYFYLVLLMAVAAVIRIQGVGEYAYHPDEIMHMDIAKGKDIAEVLDFSLFETHPPLGHILRHYWLEISADIAFQRSLSLLFGLALIPIYYCIGRLIKNEFTGLCLALLAAFSTGLVIQSYIVRNYTIFVFFLSCAFYYYLRWRNTGFSSHYLWFYWVFALCAELTHFSAVFTVFVIAAYETVSLLLYHREKRVVLFGWISLNLSIALMAGLLFYLWQGVGSAFTFAALKDFYITKGKYSPSDLLVTALFYPALVFPSLMPRGYSFDSAVVITVFSWIIARKYRHLTLLMLFSFITGMLLVASGSYQFFSTRRCLWIAPFVITGCGVAAAECLETVSMYLTQQRRFCWLPVFAVLLLVLGILSYDTHERFAETGFNGRIRDYNIMKTPEIEAITRYLDTLDEHSLVILDRGTVFLFAPANPYSYLDRNSNKAGALAFMPYHHTQIMFGASYFDFALLFEKNMENNLKSSDKLVFIKTPFSDDFFHKLAECENTDKTILSFETSQAIIISTKVFLEEMVNPTGKYHHCIQLKTFPSATGF